MKRKYRFVVILLLASAAILLSTPVYATTCPTSGTDVTIAADCQFDAGTYTFSGTLTINAGVTVTASSDVGSGQVIIQSDNINIQGTLTATGHGFAANTGTGVGTAGGGGGGHGGDGGDGSTVGGGGVTYGSVTAPSTLGSGGFTVNGGAGGGAIKLVATGTVTVGGTVSSEGSPHPAGTGGRSPGAGGSIWIQTGTLAGDGAVSADGGDCITSCGGGGGGRVAVYYATDSSTLISGEKITAYGGIRVSNGHQGGAGTIFLDDTDDANVNGALVVDNNNAAAIGSTSTTTQATDASLTFDTVTVRDGAKYVIPSGFTLITASGGTLTGGGSLQPSVTVDAGGTFSPPSPTFAFTAIDVTNSGTVGIVTSLTVGPTATFTHSVTTGSFSAGLSSLTVGSGGSGTFAQAGTGALSVPTVTVASGGTLTHSANTTSKANELNISATTIDVQSSGSVNADSKGYSANNGPGAASSGGNGAGGYGGHGGNDSNNVAGGPTYGSVTAPDDLGSGGRTGSCTGGPGGGAIKLAVSGMLTVGGTVSANGGSVAGNCGVGAGSGGSIWVTAATLAGGGTVTANGGGNTSNGGGGGGGGRIAIHYAADSSTIVSGDGLSASGGVKPANGQSGGAGTIFLDDTDDANANGALLVDNNNIAGTGASSTTDQVTVASQTYDSITVKDGAKYIIPDTFTLSVASGGTLTGSGSTQPLITVASGGVLNTPSATFSLSGLDVTNNGTVGVVTSLTVGPTATFTHSTAAFFGAGLTSLTVGSGGSGTFAQAGLGALSVPTVTVTSGGTLTHSANTTSKANELNISATTVDVQSGGSVSANGKGYSANNGTGTGTVLGGAGYGGHGGGDSTGATGGVTYGSVTAPDDLGSGGRTGSCTGGAGGGALKLAVSGALTIDGTVSADGTSVSGNCTASPGSGGSVWITSTTLTGGGAVTANGGTNTTNSGGGGGGGRIAVTYATDSSTLISGDSLSASGGVRSSTSHSGGAGTIFLDDTNDALANGALLVDNNNVAGTGTSSTTDQVAGTSQTYDSVTVKDGTKYVIPSTSTLIVSSGGTLTGGGSSQPSLTVDAGGTFSPPSSTFAFTGLDVTNNGTIGVVTNLTVGPTATFTHSVTTGSFSAGLTSLTVGSGGSGTFAQAGTGALTVAAVTVASGGTLTHSANTTSKANELNISATTVDVQSGGSVSAAGKGYSVNTGTGVGTAAGAGAGHGGHGGDYNATPAGGPTYGSVTQPTDIGSGGRNNTGTAGTGGGAIKLAVSGTVTVNGTVSADGAAGVSASGGGGSGGSVWISAGTIAGGGTVTAKGGGGGPTAGGGGGGGRIAVTYATDSSTLISGDKLDASGGLKIGGTQHSGGAGTVFLDDTDDALANGDLVVDNNNVAGTGTSSTTDQVAGTSQTYDNVTISDGAKYVVPNTASLTVVAGGMLTGNGSTDPTLTVNSGGTLGLTGAMTDGSLAVTNSGTFNLSGDMEMSSGTFRVTGAITGGLTSLTIDGGNFINAATNNIFSGSDLVINSGGTYTHATTSQLVVGTVTVNSGGTLTHADNTTTRTAYVNISATTFTVAAGGLVTANGLGLDSSEGTGQGTDAGTAGGGGYGGAGGNGSTPGAGGVTYGSPANPDDLGSGGGDDTGVAGQQGGSGGGQIKIVVSGTTTLDGTISANGANGTANEAGGGSGGSIRIDTDTWAGAGSGSLTANGGAGAGSTTGGGGGGGGRVAVYYVNNTFSGTCAATGGSKGGTGAATAGASGTCTDAQSAPAISVVAHDPTPTPTTADAVTISCDASYEGGLDRIELYLDGTSPTELEHTCDYSGETTTQSCSTGVGQLTIGSHTTTCIAYGIDATSNQADDTFSVQYPAPTTTSISPDSATAGNGAFTLTVNGTGFISSSTVRWNGSNRTTTFVNSTQLTASILAGDVDDGGTFPVTVFTTTPGGGTSNSQTFTVNNPAPTTTSLSPDNIAVGSGAFTLTVNGTGFVPSSVVRWNGSSRTTSFVNSTQLTASILAGDVSSSGTASVTVFNPTPSGGTSNAQTFTVAPDAEVPVTTSISPTTRTAGGSTFSLTVLGTDFVASSVVRWNGSSRATSFVSSTQLSATILSTDITTAGTASVTVFTPAPGGGTSNAQTLTINNPTPSLTVNVGSSTGTCGTGFTSSGGTVALGLLTTAAVTSSDASSVPHVCIRVTSNATGGSSIQVQSLNGALKSATTVDQIGSSTGALSSGVEGYGLCVGSGGSDVGSASGATPVRSSPFDGSCSTSNHAVGAVTGSYQPIWTLSGAATNAFARIFVKAGVSSSTPYHNNYTDTLTFIVTGTY